MTIRCFCRIYCWRDLVVLCSCSRDYCLTTYISISLSLSLHFTVQGVYFYFVKLCGSKNYPYLPYGRDFFLSTPPSHLSGNSSSKNVKHLPKFLDLYMPSDCSSCRKFIAEVMGCLASHTSKCHDSIPEEQMLFNCKPA